MKVTRNSVDMQMTVAEEQLNAAGSQSKVLRIFAYPFSRATGARWRRRPSLYET